MSSLILLVLFFLGVSLLFYVLFGGADFGAGILELSLGSKSRTEERRLITHAMAPVWEANHIWLVLAVVILFMGFPEVYVLITTYLYIPLTAILMGIVARGCAFTFRHYDSLGKEYHRTYSLIFALSSAWSAFFLGVTAGALMLGRISTQAAAPWNAYVYPWLNWFCVSVGFFACALFAFIASIYLIGEAKTESTRATFVKKAKTTNIVVVATGALVFFCAEIDGLSLARSFFSNRASAALFVIASVLWVPFWTALRRPRNALALRVLAASVISLVMLGWFVVRYPIALQTLDRGGISFADAAAPNATLKALLGALVFGCAMIFPALIYLLKVFKWETLES